MNTIITQINSKQFNICKHNIEELLNVTDIQTYFPILNNYLIEDTDTEETNYTLKTTYIIDKIIEDTTPIINKTNTPYLKTFANVSLRNIYDNKTCNKDLFIKINPLLDVTGYVLNQFKLTNNILPNENSNITSNYINNFNNEAYIDPFFSYLGSKLTETGKTPSFPKFYGTYSCISKKFKFDITEDYSQIKYNTIFDKNKHTLFDIEEIEIDMDDSDTCSDISHNSLEIISNDILNLESIDNVRSEIENISSLEDLKETYKPNNSNTVKITDIDNNYNFTDIIDDNNTFKFINLKDFPTQLIFIEKLEYTLDDLMENEDISDEEWLSILFQICFGLAVVQKKYNFVHNDLHSSNIMFSKTQQEFLFFEINKKIYKIPTFGKITKIIDFGRATFTHNNIIYFSSVFDENGDAEGQYDYPEENSFKNCKLKPNKSFDLARLATTIITYFDHDSIIFKLIKPWMTDKYNNFLIDEEDDFDLYKKIAKDVKNAIPIKQLSKPIFKTFITNKPNSHIHIFRY